MNALAAALLWGALQVTLFTLVGLALYLFARRRGPAAGSLAAASCLLMAMGVSALALAPWPRWYALAPAAQADRRDAARSVSTSQSALSPTDDETRTPGKRQAIESSPDASWAGAAWQGFWRGLRQGQEAEIPAGGAVMSNARSRWPEFLGAAFLAGLLLALLRLALGLAAVRRLRAKTQPIIDSRLDAFAAELCRRLNSRPAELRESFELDSPATVGWRRPSVILPSQWREWTEGEQRVVLAHELAHIGRGDYLTGLLAQLSLALHFYHPLIHWLARRLRLEQELAADALGAEAAGGRETYLITLAQMALKQDDRAIAWAARPFLPSRGAFLRRIEMLRNPRQFRPAAISRRRQLGIVAAFGVVGLLFAGLRGPSGESAAQQPAEPAKAAAPASAAADRQTETDWSYVPPNAAVVAIVRPATLTARAKAQALARLLDEQMGLRQALGLPLEEIGEVQFVMPSFPARNLQAESDAGIVVIRAAAPHDWKPFGDKAARKPVAASFLGKSYFKPDESSPRAFSYHLPDDRTIVLASEPQLKRVLALSKTSATRPDWAADWPGGEAAAMVNVSLFNSVFGQMLQQSPQAGAISGFAPLWQQTERAFVSLKLTQGLQLEGRAECSSAENAQNVSRTLEAALTLAANNLAQLGNSLAAAPNQTQTAGEMLILSDLGTTLIKQARVKTDGTTVRFQVSESDLDVADIAVTLLAPAVTGARTAARRSQSMNNLKQLMLAMHNYADVNKHFPAAVIIGPDGKTPHSWRIEMLPYVDQAALYQQYKMDEPWDSENNKKVLEQMPAVFRHPAADPNSKDASYFAITGETTIFPGMKPSGFADIRDGTSNTIALVEAQRSIPWTKPEDIAYDPAKPLPKFGGFEPNVFVAAVADGSVRNIAQNVDEKILRALFTRAGGEVVQIPQLPGN